MSDEASGPDDSDGEDKEEWEKKVALAVGSAITMQHQKPKVYEYVMPGFRSNFVSNLV